MVKHQSIQDASPLTYFHSIEPSSVGIRLGSRCIEVNYPGKPRIVKRSCDPRGSGVKI